MEIKTTLHPSKETVLALQGFVNEQVKENLKKVNDAKDSIIKERLRDLDIVVIDNYHEFTVKKLHSGIEKVVYKEGTSEEMIIVTFYPVKHELESISFEYK